MEKRFKLKVRGMTDLIMHNSEAANPMNEYTLEKKPIMNKRANKTENDHMKLAELDFLSSLYWSESLDGLYMPVENVQKMLLEAGRALDQKKAKKQIVGVRFETHIGWPLQTPNRSDKTALLADKSNKYFKIVTVQKSKLPNTKAIFKEWAFDCEIIIDTDIVDVEVVRDWWDYAGRRVGLGSRRPYAPTPGHFGVFLVDEFKEV